MKTYYIRGYYIRTTYNKEKGNFLSPTHIKERDGFVTENIDFYKIFTIEDGEDIKDKIEKIVDRLSSDRFNFHLAMAPVLETYSSPYIITDIKLL